MKVQLELELEQHKGQLEDLQVQSEQELEQNKGELEALKVQLEQQLEQRKAYRSELDMVEAVKVQDTLETSSARPVSASRRHMPIGGREDGGYQSKRGLPSGRALQSRGWITFRQPQGSSRA
jgi:hypothetical protein